MRPNQYTKFYINSNDEEFEYSDGIINVETIRGSDKNTGIWSIPDVGQATIVSRNPELDPHINPKVRYGNKIRIIGSEDSYEVFNGFINDVSVEYNPFGGDTVVTIHAIDTIGLLQKHYFTEDFCDYLRTQNSPYSLGGGVTIADLAFFMNSYGEIPNVTIFYWEDYEVPAPTNTLAKYAIKPGDNAWDVITQLCQSSLLQISSLQNLLTVMPYYKHNTYIEDPMVFTNPQFLFASDGNPEGYKSITLDDGFDRTTNQVSLNNNSCQWFGASDFTEISTSYGPYNEQPSIAEWGTTNLSLTTLIQDAVSITTTMDALSYDILEDGSQPEIDITSITFDGTINPNTGLIQWFYPFLSWSGAAINIKHNVNQSIQIDKNYEIIGIANSIDYSNHLVTVYLRPSIEYLVQEQMTEIPTITINALSGDTNFNFSASISDFTPANIERVEWTYEDLSGIGGWQTQSTSLTPTWNYDPSVSPEYWQGPGPKTVRLRLYSITGWMYTAYVELNVTAAVPTADFTFTESYGTVTFLDTSFDADTWLWDFGDGNTSTEQNPVHHYESNNTFNVQLQISNGVLTDSITKPVTIDLSKIECNYVKFEWSGTATVTGGVPDKYWLEKVVYIDLPITPGISAPINLDNYANVDKAITAGNVYNADGTTVWAAGQNTWSPSGALTTNPDQILTNFSRYTTNVWVKPQVSGSTQTYGASLIIKPRQMLDSSRYYDSASGTAKIAVENLLNARLWILKNSWVTGRTYQPINIYVSADGTNWNQIGSTGTVIGPAQIPSGTTGAAVLNLDATVPMPPYYP